MNEAKRNEMREAFGRYVIRETKSPLNWQKMSVDELLKLSQKVQTEEDLYQLHLKYCRITSHNRRVEKNQADYAKVQEILTETLKKGDVVTVMGISDYLKKNRIVFNRDRDSPVCGRPQLVSQVLNEWVEKGLAKRIGVTSNYHDGKWGGYSTGYKIL